MEFCSYVRNESYAKKERRGKKEADYPQLRGASFSLKKVIESR